MKTVLYKTLFSAALLLWGLPAHGQSVSQSGSVVAGQSSYWVTNGIIGSAGNAADSLITSLGVTNATVPGFCVNSGRATAAGRQRLCLGAPLNSAAQITLHVRMLAGANDHHVAEATMKALGRALDAATTLDPRIAGTVPSTKGTLTT